MLMLHSMWSMDGRWTTYTPLSVYLRVIFFGTPYMYYVWDQAVQQEFPVVILNSTLHYQIFKFDIDIQILVWMFGSTYRKGEILKQK